MKLIERLELIFVPSQREKEERVELKEIVCKRKGEDFIKKLKTAAVGCEYSNPDGSDRQKALAKVKAGDRVRLIWDAAAGGNNTVYLLRRGKGQELSMPECFGRLGDKVAAEVVRWLTRDNIVTSATVIRITGGTRKNPKLGCVLELRTYPGPQKKKGRFGILKRS
jgi:hypothetical protein